MSNELRTTNYVIMQNKANLPNTQMTVTSAKTIDYEQITMNNANKNKPNSNPIQSQSQFAKIGWFYVGYYIICLVSFCSD